MSSSFGLWVTITQMAEATPAESALDITSAPPQKPHGAGEREPGKTKETICHEKVEVKWASLLWPGMLGDMWLSTWLRRAQHARCPRGHLNPLRTS